MRALPPLPCSLAVRALARIPLVILAMSGCHPSASVHVRNNPPVPTLLYPADTDTLHEGAPTTLVGTVADTNDVPADLQVTWWSGEEALCEAAPVAEDGSSTCEAVFEPGVIDVTLAAVDPDGDEGRASVGVTVRPNDAPVVEILSPEEGSSWTDDARVVVEARVSDFESAADELALAWTDEAGAVLDIDTVVDSDGSLVGTLLFAEGSHTITLSATDGPGETGARSVTFDVFGG